MAAEPDLLEFFKALSDGNRLKIVGLLAQESYSGEVLADMLDIKPATVSHHLSYLAHAGLVEARLQGHSKLYRLRLEVVHAMANRLLASETLPRAAAGVDTGAYERKVLRDFLCPDGSLKEIPAQQKKLRVVLNHIVESFAPDKKYSEKDVNGLLARFHADTASLRRELIGHGLMARANGKYRRL
ncbi:MAG: metalloregulator ArsR/SmtB family transcription factor [Anaerolineales bacterium]|nr:metalloregulator ArsR/SmtB family transcription factor [Anaerolineales bacterium]